MIQANELRIGNLILDSKGFVLLIKSISEKNKQVSGYFPKLNDFGSDYYDDCRPIPLTEEILTKCGFRKSKLEGYDVHFRYDHQLLHSSVTSIYNADFSIKLDNVARGVKSLHQLQNLFFALTGNELEVKL